MSSRFSWSFRPSVFQNINYPQLSVNEIVEYYVRDNERAQKEGVNIPPHPSEQTPPPQQHNKQSFLRTAQWNLQAWTSPTRERNCMINHGIRETIFTTNADVLILNEYHWNDRHVQRQGIFEQELKQYGYHHYYCAKCNRTPTLIATKCHVLQYQEIVLSRDRSALCLKLDCNNGTVVWVIGTHLDAFDGNQRRKEMQCLLEKLETKMNINISNNTSNHETPIIISGDFNQQRQQDYTEAEWKLIEKSMERRKVCHDDGVSTLLTQHNFCCAFDQLSQSPQIQHQQQHDANLGRIPTTTTTACRCGCGGGGCFNWECASRPPSTHWSGTTIDYSYSRNIAVQGVYISPAGFSDHRMTVCDWELPESTTTTSTTLESVVVKEMINGNNKINNIELSSSSSSPKDGSHTSGTKLDHTIPNTNDDNHRVQISMTTSAKETETMTTNNDATTGSANWIVDEGDTTSSASVDSI